MTPGVSHPPDWFSLIGACPTQPAAAVALAGDPHFAVSATENPHVDQGTLVEISRRHKGAIGAGATAHLDAGHLAGPGKGWQARGFAANPNVPGEQLADLAASCTNTAVARALLCNPSLPHASGVGILERLGTDWVSPSGPEPVRELVVSLVLDRWPTFGGRIVAGARAVGNHYAAARHLNLDDAMFAALYDGRNKARWGVEKLLEQNPIVGPIAERTGNVKVHARWRRFFAQSMPATEALDRLALLDDPDEQVALAAADELSRVGSDTVDQVLAGHRNPAVVVTARRWLTRHTPGSVNAALRVSAPLLAALSGQGGPTGAVVLHAVDGVRDTGVPGLLRHVAPGANPRWSAATRSARESVIRTCEVLDGNRDAWQVFGVLFAEGTFDNPAECALTAAAVTA